MEEVSLEQRCPKGEVPLYKNSDFGAISETKRSCAMPISRGGGGGVLPYMGYIGMCRCEGYGFQAVYSSIGCINQSVWF